MHKKIKIFIILFFVFIFSMFFCITSAKYVIENTQVVAKLDIDRCPPIIEVSYIATSQTANQSNLIKVRIKIIEKNIARDNLSPDNITITMNGKLITPEFKNFSCVLENSTEKLYDFSFSCLTGKGSLSIFIPEGIVEDKSGLINTEKIFFADI